VALGADVVARGPGGERTIPARELFRGVFETALEPNEVLTEIRVPRSSGGWAYEKFNRRAQDWATVGVAVARTDGGVGVALTSMGPTPVHAAAVENALAAGADPAAAAEHAADDADPQTDTNASADFRRHLARVLTRRALERAL